MREVGTTIGRDPSLAQGMRPSACDEANAARIPDLRPPTPRDLPSHARGSGRPSSALSQRAPGRGWCPSQARAQRSSSRPAHALRTGQARSRGASPENGSPRFTGAFQVGGTGLEPVTPSLSRRGSRSRPFAQVRLPLQTGGFWLSRRFTKAGVQQRFGLRSARRTSSGVANPGLPANTDWRRAKRRRADRRRRTVRRATCPPDGSELQSPAACAARAVGRHPRRGTGGTSCGHLSQVVAWRG